MPESHTEIKTEPRRWFRFYAESINDPKVQRLPPHLFKTWVNLLCLTCANGGNIPPISDVAFQLRMSEFDAQSQVDELIGLGLIDIATDKTLEPHNWKGRQFLSDTSNERVRKHRAKKAEASQKPECNVTVTPPDTDTDTDTEVNYQRSITTPREADAALPEVSNLKILSDRLMQVAAPCLASQAVAPGLVVMTVPMMWLDQGADLERDVIPAIQGIVAKGKRNISTWDYFTKPVAENKARRLKGLPHVELPAAKPYTGKLKADGSHETQGDRMRRLLAEYGHEGALS